MPRHLFIVSRHDAYLAEYLREHFSGEPDVQVLMDRRRSERRRAAANAAPNRRRADRRARPQVDQALRTQSHAFVTVE